MLITHHIDRVDGINYYVTMDDSQNKNDDEKTLFVSWVFGEARWFPKCLARVAYKATIDDGELVDSHGQKWTNSGFPTVITGEKSLHQNPNSGLLTHC